MADTKGDNPMWEDWNLIFGRAHDVLVAGYGGKTVNWLRLFSAWASEKSAVKSSPCQTLTSMIRP